MILRAVSVLVALLAVPPAFAADSPARVPPDRGAMSQSIATPIEPARADGDRGAAPARKAKRVRHTIPPPRRM